MLGLSAGADEREIAAARRRLAKQAHPDAGGSVGQMQRLNDAATAALSLVASRKGSKSGASSPSRHVEDDGPSSGRHRRDHPSFIIEALPVEAFEALVVVSSAIGDLIDDEPPYALEIALAEPRGGWCRLDLVPDAGSSTVSVTVAGEPGHPVPSVDAVRDAFVDGLNQLDWDQLAR